MLSNHNFDTKMSAKTTKSNRQQNKQQDNGESMSFTQPEGKCYCCGEAGHKFPRL